MAITTTTVKSKSTPHLAKTVGLASRANPSLSTGKSGIGAGKTSPLETATDVKYLAGAGKHDY